MGKYFLFDRNSKPGRWIDDPQGDDVPTVDWYYWRQGHLVPDSEVIPDPIRFSLEPYNPHSSDDSPHMPSFLQADAPIFSDALIQAFLDCGVDNIIPYNCEITDPDNGQVYTNYKAVNIIGLVAAADMGKSNATINPNGPPLIDVDFDGLVIDDKSTYGASFFRLAESTNALIIHERVRDCLLAKGFDDLAFYETEKVAL